MFPSGLKLVFLLKNNFNLVFFKNETLNKDMSLNISIFDYMNPHDFLKDFYDQQKQIDPEFSYTSWAKAIGFSNKTILRLIVYKKRRITDTSAKLITQYFNFEHTEHQYFKLLISYSECKTIHLKKQLSIELIKMQRELSVKKYQLINTEALFDVYSPVILTIINTAHAPMTAIDIQKFCPLNENKINDILGKLANLDVLTKIEDSYFRKSQSFKIPDQSQNLNLKKYYEFWLEKSAQAINAPYEQRRYRSLQLPLSQNEFEKIVSKTNEFALSLLADVENNDLTDRKIYMFNTAVFPVDVI